MLEAGVETVNNTAVFMFLYLVRNEAIQKRLQNEIDEVIGPDRTPSLSDRTRFLFSVIVGIKWLILIGRGFHFFFCAVFVSLA